MCGEHSCDVRGVKIYRSGKWNTCSGFAFMPKLFNFLPIIEFFINTDYSHFSAFPAQLLWYILVMQDRKSTNVSKLPYGTSAISSASLANRQHQKTSPHVLAVSRQNFSYPRWGRSEPQSSLASALWKSAKTPAAAARRSALSLCQCCVQSRILTCGIYSSSRTSQLFSTSPSWTITARNDLCSRTLSVACRSPKDSPFLCVHLRAS